MAVGSSFFPYKKVLGEQMAARHWAGGRTSKKYRMPVSQKPNSMVARITKRLASRFYQTKTGHCLSGQHHWTKNPATPQRWRRRYRI